MTNFELVKKDIALTVYESKQAEASGRQGAKIYALPQPVLELFVRRNLVKFRAESLKIKLPEVKMVNAVKKEELKLDGGAGEFSVYLYRRENLDISGELTFPLFYFIHGGGFIGGTHLANDSLMRKLCDEHDIICASVDYHVSPEVRYPVALNECATGLNKLLNSGEFRYIDKGAVFIAGDSAGGNLAAALSLHMKNRGGFAPKGQILLYPVTQMRTLDTESYLRKEIEFFSMRKGMSLSRKLYARNRKDYGDLYFSPLCSTAKDDLNPTPALLLLSGRDGLLDDGVLYAKHLNELGGCVRCVVYEKAFHAFMNGFGDSNAAIDAYEEITRFVFYPQLWTHTHSAKLSH